LPNKNKGCKPYSKYHQFLTYHFMLKANQQLHSLVHHICGGWRFSSSHVPQESFWFTMFPMTIAGWSGSPRAFLVHCIPNGHFFVRRNPNWEHNEPKKLQFNDIYVLFSYTKGGGTMYGASWAQVWTHWGGRPQLLFPCKPNFCNLFEFLATKSTLKSISSTP
jgi:hypothetical protein